MRVYGVVPCADVTAEELKEIHHAASPYVDVLCVIINSPDPDYRDGLEYFCKQHNLEYKSFPLRLGKAAAVREGLKVALADRHCGAICQIDGHLKQSPADVGRLLALLDRADLAVYSRYRDGHYGSAHRAALAPLMAKLVRQISGVEMTDTVCGTRAYSRDFAEFFIQHTRSAGYGLEIEQVLLAGLGSFDVAEYFVESAPQADNTAAEKLLSNFYAVLAHLDPCKFAHIQRTVNSLIYAISRLAVYELDCACLDLTSDNIFFEPVLDGEDNEASYRLRMY